MKNQTNGKQEFKEIIVNCAQCNQQHKAKLDFSKLTKEQLENKEPILPNFICPNIALMYRVMGFAIDTTVNIFKEAGLKDEQIKYANYYKSIWGELNLDRKLERFKKLNMSFIGVPDEYYDLLSPIVSSYCCGYFYPAITSTGTLGERILNRLIIKTREYFKSSKYYKQIYNKQSFDSWDSLIKILEDWEIITNTVAKKFLELKKYRNDSVHYNDGYDFELKSHDAIKILTDIINLQFNYMNRKDLFWVFNVPGEIWVRSEVVNTPFVKEFVLPNCLQLSPFCEPTENPPIKTKNLPLKPLTDEDFISMRKNRQKLVII